VTLAITIAVDNLHCIFFFMNKTGAKYIRSMVTFTLGN